MQGQFGAAASREFVEQRASPRHALDVEIRVYPRGSSVVRGHTVDISDSGLAALVVDDVPVGEIVRLEFILPFGDVEILAVVRQRTAFRYGFQFLDSGPVRETIRRTCQELAITQTTSPKVL